MAERPANRATTDHRARVTACSAGTDLCANEPKRVVESSLERVMDIRPIAPMYRRGKEALSN